MPAYGPGRSIVAAGTAVPAARFTPHLRVALRFAQVPTGHTLPSGALALRRSLKGWVLPWGAGLTRVGRFSLDGGDANIAGSLSEGAPAKRVRVSESGKLSRCRRQAAWLQAAPSVSFADSSLLRKEPEGVGGAGGGVSCPGREVLDCRVVANIAGSLFRGSSREAGEGAGGTRTFPLTAGTAHAALPCPARRPCGRVSPAPPPGARSARSAPPSGSG